MGTTGADPPKQSFYQSVPDHLLDSDLLLLRRCFISCSLEQTRNILRCSADARV